MDIFKLFSKKRSFSVIKRQPAPRGFKPFILEAILTPSDILGVSDTPDHLILDLHPPQLPEVDFSDIPPDHLPDISHTPDHLPDNGGTHTITDADAQIVTDGISHDQIEPLPFIHQLDVAEVSLPDIHNIFDSGIFTVGDTGKVSIDYLYDGGGYQGQLAIFSLKDMEGFDLNTETGLADFIHEAAHRALSDSDLGHVIINDQTERAKFDGLMPSEWENHNFGEYKGVKTFDMQAGERFAVMLVPNGTVQQVLDGNQDAGMRPLFSLHTVNPNEAFHAGQIADVTGDGNTFVLEDLRTDGTTDRDYNDIIFQVRGATGTAAHLDDVINHELDWRGTDLGKGLIEYAKSYVEPASNIHTGDVNLDHLISQEPTTDSADAGVPSIWHSLSDLHNFNSVDGTIDSSNIQALPFITSHLPELDVSHAISEPHLFDFSLENQPLVGIINSDNLNIAPADHHLPIWTDSHSSTNDWAQSLTAFVDAAKASNQPHAIAYIQLDAALDSGTHGGFSSIEQAALAYAQKNGVVLVVGAGDTPNHISALGEMSQYLDNVLTVGGAERISETGAISTAFAAADYSGGGAALDLVATGDWGDIVSTNISAAKVAAAASQVWAVNPELNYTQVIDILKRTATDLGAPNWDAETGAGLLNITAALHLARATEPEIYTSKPGARRITDNFLSQTGTDKQLPGDPTHPAITPPGIPQTNVDTGGNNIANATQLLPSATQDVMDQVSSIDLTDIYRVDSRYLAGAGLSVLSGNLSVSFLTPSGQVLGSQVLNKGTHKLELPANAPEEVLLQINQQDGTPATYVLKGFASTATEPFNIDLEFASGLSASQQAVMQAAAKSVAGLIAKGLPSAIVDGKIIDDINIKISTANLDGANGTQAQTKIDFMRFGSLLPAQSLVQFDGADIAELERSGQLFSVAQHEFLHALGFGNLWEAKGLIDYAGTPLAQFNGQHSVAEFQELGGLTDAISLETEGDGSADLHWNENLFQDEVMTYDLGFKKGADGKLFSPISTVTIASLADLGYEVNLGQATPDYGLFGGQKFDPASLTPEQIEAFRQLAEEAAADQPGDVEEAILPEVDPDKVAPEIWAHAEKFWKNGEYYDWERYQIQRYDTLSELAQWRLGHGTYDYYKWIGDHNGISNYDYIVTGNWIELPKLHPNYEWEQEQERLRREEELKRQQEEEARKRKEEEDRLNNNQAEQDRKRQEEEARQREAEAHQRELEEQQRRLEEEQRRRRQQEEYEREQARLRELARQAEIARQQGKGGLDWYLAKPLDFGNADPFEINLGDVVGNLVPDDYYRFTLSRSGRLTAELKQLLADADLVLYDARNEPISYSMRDGLTDEQIITDLIPGTYMLRVNSPKGVTTDYDLIVRFQHLLSATQKGPPPGWKVGGGNKKGGSGNTVGITFSDPRLKQVYDRSVNNFEVPLKRTLDSQVAALKAERAQYEQEQRKILDQMSAELRGKVYSKLDDIRNNLQGRIDSVANDLNSRIDSAANDALNSINNVIPDWACNAPFVGDAVRNVRDSLKGAVNGARDWLEGQVNGVRNTIKDLISQFAQKLKDAYKTGAEINTEVEKAAQWLRGEIDKQVDNLNGFIGSFKGKILAPMEFAKNVQVGSWNAYDALSGLVDGATNGAKNAVSAVGGFFKDRVSDAEYLVQLAVGEIAHLLGDDTGRKYNEMRDKMQEIDNQINSLTGNYEYSTRNKRKEIESIVRKIEALLTDPEERKRALDALFQHGYQTAEDAYNFVKEELPKVRDKIAQEAKELVEKAKKAFADLVRSLLKSQLADKGSINLKSNLKVGIGAIVAGGNIKPGVEYELSRDGNSYTVSSKGILGIELDGGLETPVGGGVSVAGIANQDIKFKFDPKLEGAINPSVGLMIKHEFVDSGERADDEMVKLGGWIFKELPTPVDVITDPILSRAMISNLKSIETIAGFEISGELSLGNLDGEAKGSLNLFSGNVRGNDGLFNSQFKIEGNTEGEISLGLGGGAGLKSSIAIETRENKLQKFTLEIEGSVSGIIASGAISMFAPNSSPVTNLIEDAKLKLKLAGKGIGTLRMKIELKDFEKLAQSSMSVYQALVDLTHVENGAELTSDIRNTIKSGVSFLSALNSSTSISIEADTKQLLALEAAGKFVVKGELESEIGRVETKTIYSNK